MSTDHPAPPPGVRPAHLVAGVRDALGNRWRAVAPARRLGVLVVVLLALGGAWFVLRPRPRPAIEDLLPRASGAAPAATGAPATGPGTSGTSGAPAAGAPGAVVVHVVGAVRDPGVVRVAAGARVLDAVDAAGGPRDDADLARVNLAAKLVDGQRVVVPVLGEAVPIAVDGGSASSGGAAARAAPSPEAPLDLNQATEAQLDALPGIGPATAAAIVAHRTQHGPFRSVDALADVRGIGPAKLDQLRPYLVVS